MQSALKWGGIALGVIVLVMTVLFLVARFYIGVNIPLGGGETDPDRLSRRIELPEGFTMSVYAQDIPGARILRFSRTGDLLVSFPSSGKILILGRDRSGDGRADGHRVLMENLNGPNGLDFFEDWLYVAEEDAIGRVRFDHETGTLAGDYVRLITGLPGGGNHWKKTLRFGPDDMLYVSTGSSCNVCIEEDARRAALLRFHPEGGDGEIFASGLRNSAGFDWSPMDGAIYATDNGRDLLGDDFPPCELNRVEKGGHYGWPWANGKRIPDPDFGTGRDEIIARTVAPVHEFRAHNAPLGIVFVRGETFPEEYRGAAIVALHGSWNRTEKDGYKVVSLHRNENGGFTERDFVSGFLKDDHVIGRPAEVTEGPDGAIYISDDYAGAVYRVAWGEDPSRAMALTPEVTKSLFDARETLSRYTIAERQRLAGEGKRLFGQFGCGNCHDATGRAVRKLNALGERYDITTLSDFLERPNPPMPVFPMSGGSREALAVYLIEQYP